MSPPAHIWSGFPVWSTRNVTLAQRLSFHFDPRATRMRWIPTTNHNVNDSTRFGYIHGGLRQSQPSSPQQSDGLPSLRARKRAGDRLSPKSGWATSIRLYYTVWHIATLRLHLGGTWAASGMAPFVGVWAEAGHFFSLGCVRSRCKSRSMSPSDDVGHALYRRPGTTDQAQMCLAACTSPSAT
jgi:hypothetical protein